MNAFEFIISFLIGVLSSIVASTLFPSLTEVIISAIVRLFKWLPLRRSTPLSGNWIATWHIDSERYPPKIVDENAIVKHFGSRFYAKSRLGNFECFLIGNIDNARYITGKWYDETLQGYHGAFQFIVDPATGDLKGKWIGFSTKGFIKHGVVDWERKKSQS